MPGTGYCAYPDPVTAALHQAELFYEIHSCTMSGMRDLTLREARQLLVTWGADRDAVDQRRDEVIRIAVDAGISKSEAHRITGISRSTIDRIVASAPGDPQTAHSEEQRS
jgi:DNA invertase Pin-like site-specific DNA recombinase